LRRIRLFALWLIAVSIPGPATAQSSTTLARDGVLAYQRLDYDLAVAFLTRALTLPGPAALPDTMRAETYVYLGAAQLFRGRPEAAAASFRRAIGVDPRHRPDELIFPPPVIKAFEAAGGRRRDTRAHRWWGAVPARPPSRLPPARITARRGRTADLERGWFRYPEAGEAAAELPGPAVPFALFCLESSRWRPSVHVRQSSGVLRMPS